MKKLIHLSDLHFGTEKAGIVSLLIEDIQRLNPDIIIVSGDLTQRALQSQFRNAKYFLDAFSNTNILCVPGNHDISLYNLIERFFFTFSKYKKFISPNLSPQYYDNFLAILGVNTVTPFKPMGGFIAEEQLEYVQNFFESQSQSKIKIIVMHHNLIRSKRHKTINDANKIITTFSECNVNLILSGHIHNAYIEQISASILSRKMYVVTAGTAISTRSIGPNSFNIFELYDTEFQMSVREFHEGKFTTTKVDIFKL